MLGPKCVFEDIERRSYLGALAGAMSALAGCSGTDDDETTAPTRNGDRDGTTADGTVGAPDRPNGTTETTDEPPAEQMDLPVHNHSGPDAGGDNLSPATVTTEHILNAVNDAAIQASFDGLVVPVAPGLGMADAIDPSETATPIQDAIDAIDATEWYNPEFSPGAVLLPAGRIEEQGSLTNTVMKSFLGHGIKATEVRFTDLSKPAIEQASVSAGDGSQTFWDGIRFNGVDGANRTGAAIYIDKPGVRYFDVGRVVFREWNDVIYLDEECWFECYWDSFGAIYIYGRSIVADGASLGASAWLIDKLNLYRDDGAGRIIDARNAGGGNFMIRDLHIQINGEINGESGPPPIEVNESSFGRFRIDNLHYETTVGLDLPAIVRFSRGSKYQIDMVDVLGPTEFEDQTLVLDNVVQLQDVGQVRIGQHNKNPPATTIEQSWLGVSGAALDGAVRFEGDSSQVTETSGSTGGKVWALEDMRVVDPFHKETVTHTTGGPTEINGISAGQTGTGREGRKVTPRVQRLDPVSMPNADFGVDTQFIWRGSTDYERWVLRLDWVVDPGVDMDFELEVTTRGPG